MGVLGIMLTDGPWQTERWETVTKIAEAALDKGHGVKLFLFLDGVYNPIKHQNFPDFTEQPVDSFKRLTEKGAMIVTCGICTNARGLQDGKDYVDNIKSAGLPDYSEFLGDATSVITF